MVWLQPGAAGGQVTGKSLSPEPKPNTWHSRTLLRTTVPVHITCHCFYLLHYFSPWLCHLSCWTQFTLFNRWEEREPGICWTALWDGFGYSHLLAHTAKFREERSPLKTHNSILTFQGWSGVWQRKPGWEAGCFSRSHLKVILLSSASMECFNEVETFMAIFPVKLR